jgi:hypothetical protein
MKEARATCWVWIRLAIGLFGLAVASSCAPKAAGRQTDVMEKSGTVKVSAAELRAVVNDLADSLTSRIEGTGDRIRAETEDRGVRRRAIAFKAGGIPAVYTAAYRADPLAAVVDVWAFAFQAVHLVEDGALREAFGAQQALAREGARGLLADADAAIQRILTRPEDFARLRARVEGWAKQHPIEHTVTSRPSIAAFAAELRAEGRDAFVAVGAVSDTIENLSERLNTYAAQLPKQARWQAELLVSDMTGEHEVEGALADIRALGEAARRANDLLGDVPGLLGSEGSFLSELLAAERRAVLAGVDGQRVATLEYVMAERRVVLEAVREERIAVVEALHQERIEALKEVDAIKSRAVDASVAGLRDLVDYTLWRVAALLMGVLVSAAALAVLAYWLTLGRRRNQVIS